MQFNTLPWFFVLIDEVVLFYTLKLKVKSSCWKVVRMQSTTTVHCKYKLWKSYVFYFFIYQNYVSKILFHFGLNTWTKNLLTHFVIFHHFYSHSNTNDRKKWLPKAPYLFTTYCIPTPGLFSFQKKNLQQQFIKV